MLAKRSVSVTGYIPETFIIILIKAKRVIFQLRIISPVLERFPVTHLPHLTMPGPTVRLCTSGASAAACGSYKALFSSRRPR